MRSYRWNATAARLFFFGVIAHLSIALVANAQQTRTRADDRKQPEQGKQPANTGQGDETKPQTRPKQKWDVVFSHWSLRGSILREPEVKGTLGVSILAKAAKEAGVNQFELSSQLLEVDIRRMPTDGRASEAQDDKPAKVKTRIAALQRLRAGITDPDYTQVSIDHLEPLTLAYAQRDGEKTREFPANVSQYADWIAEAGGQLQVRSFSLTVAERGLTREEAADKAVETLISLVSAVRKLEGSGKASKSDQPSPRPAEEHKRDESKSGTDQESPQGDDQRQEFDPAQTERVEGQDQKKDVGLDETAKDVLPLHILIETGEGFRSDPKWLSLVVQEVRAQLSERKLTNVACSTLLNLGRQRVDETNATIWKALASPEGSSPLLGGVVVETQSFVVAPSKENATKVVVLAERRIDYAAALQVVGEYVDPGTPVIVRYQGPALYESNGVEASIALAKRLVTPVMMEEKRPDENERPK